MKRGLKTKPILAAMLILNASALAQSVPFLINYQGRLTDNTGAAIASGAYSIQFRLWDSPNATNMTDLIWAQQQTAMIQSNGVFNVILGSPGGASVAGATPAVNDLEYAFSAPATFLSLTVVPNSAGGVSNSSEILPRQQLLSAPYALKAADGNPPGTIVAFAGDIASDHCPPGWLPCDGRALSSRLLGRLYAAISTNWGSGFDLISGVWVKGTNDFNLPDLRGRFLRGADGGISLDPDVSTRTNLNGVVSQKAGSLQGDATRLPNNPFGTSGESNKHTHPVSTNARTEGGPNTFDSGSARGMAPTAGVSLGQNVEDHTHQVNKGGDSETRPKNAYVNYIIKY